MLSEQNSFYFDAPNSRPVQVVSTTTLSDHQPIWFQI